VCLCVSVCVCANDPHFLYLHLHIPTAHNPPSARQFKKSATIPTAAVVLLDEVGLAEQSPHLPLKVLHKILGM
jgi:hypothetical protein